MLRIVRWPSQSQKQQTDILNEISDLSSPFRDPNLNRIRKTPDHANQTTTKRLKDVGNDKSCSLLLRAAAINTKSESNRSDRRVPNTHLRIETRPVCALSKCESPTHHNAKQENAANWWSCPRRTVYRKRPIFDPHLYCDWVGPIAGVSRNSYKLIRRIPYLESIGIDKSLKINRRNTICSQD